MGDPISRTGGEARIFTNADSNRFSSEYKFPGGDLEINIFGVLDGADVSTLTLAAKQSPRAFGPIRVASWLTSDSDILNNIDTAVIYLPNPTYILFQIENAGASTDISIWATPLGEEEA